ncbi:MAG: NADH-quinone oxidoreductase subunit J [Verrucomicrobia bacterium]|nr:MAG: NADH-quinone oxidoreductase subunit J [Verrucomicrobiota bacterium]
MTAYDAIFWFFSLALLLCGVLVLISPNAVASGLYLVLSFFFLAGLYVLLEAFFLALIQILVYAGAIMVLFLFVIMLLDFRESRHWWRGNLLGWLGAPLAAGTLLTALLPILKRSGALAVAPEQWFEGTLENVMTPVFTRYLLPVEVTALILLAATIGGVVLGRKETKP